MAVESWVMIAASALAGALSVAALQQWLYRAELRRWGRDKQALTEELQQSRLQLAQLQQDHLQARVELSGARERLVSMDRVEEELFQREEELQQLQQQNSRLQSQFSAQQTRLEMSEQQHQEKLQQLEQARERLQREFHELAQRVFESNSEKFSAQQNEKLEHLLQPLRQQLGDFRRRVDDVYEREARDRRGLQAQIEHLKQLNLKMSEEAVNLTNALKSENKTQGNWGELVLESILQRSGLRAGYEYQVQFSTRDGDGRRYQPDVIIHLPEGKDVVVDAKMSLVAYERYCNADSDAARQQALNAHLESLKRHIKGLGDKSYEQLPELRSLDFVLLFIPIEGAFMAAVEADSELFTGAFERNILLVSPSTLLVTLRTINNIWRNEKQNQNALEIARRGGELYDKFVGFVDALEDVGRHLDSAQSAYETAHKRLVSGKGNLVNRVTELEKLGVRGKKRLSAELASSVADDAEPQAVSSIAASINPAGK